MTRNTKRTYETEATPLALVPGATVYRPLRRDADVDVQWAVAWRVAVCITGLAGTIGAWIHWPKLWILWISLAALCLALVGVFLWLDRDLFRDDRERRKIQTHHGDSARREAEPERHLVTLRLDEGNTSRYLHDIPMDTPMRMFAKRLHNGTAAFSERGAAECGVTRETFIILRDQLLERGIVTWKNPDSPRAGYAFGRGFEAAMRALAEFPLP